MNRLLRPPLPGHCLAIPSLAPGVRAEERNVDSTEAEQLIAESLIESPTELRVQPG
jgi:hypothetical protein